MHLRFIFKVEVAAKRSKHAFSPLSFEKHKQNKQAKELSSDCQIPVRDPYIASHPLLVQIRVSRRWKTQIREICLRIRAVCRDLLVTNESLL